MPLFKEIGLMTFALSITEASIRHLGVKRPRWHEAGYEEQADALMMDALNCGNFGKKLNARRGTAILVDNGQNKESFCKVRTVINRLKNTNHAFCPLLDKRPWLEPFVVIYRVVRYAWLVLCGKRASLRKANQFSNERKKLLDMFELYSAEK